MFSSFLRIVAFLHKHVISIVSVENLITLPYNKNDQYTHIYTFIPHIQR